MPSNLVWNQNLMVHFRLIKKSSAEQVLKGVPGGPNPNINNSLF